MSGPNGFKLMEQSSTGGQRNTNLVFSWLEASPSRAGSKSLTGPQISCRKPGLIALKAATWLEEH